MDDLVFQYFCQHLTWSIQNFAAGIDFASVEEDIAQYIVSLNITRNDLKNLQF